MPKYGFLHTDACVSENFLNLYIHVSKCWKFYPFYFQRLLLTHSVSSLLCNTNYLLISIEISIGSQRSMLFLFHPFSFFVFHFDHLCWSSFKFTDSLYLCHFINQFSDFIFMYFRWFFFYYQIQSGGFMIQARLCSAITFHPLPWTQWLGYKRADTISQVIQWPQTSLSGIYVEFSVTRTLHFWLKTYNYLIQKPEKRCVLFTIFSVILPPCSKPSGRF